MSDPKFYEADDVIDEYLEVTLEDKDFNEYHYWVKISDIPEGACDIDWPIEQAKKYHSSQELPEVPETNLIRFTLQMIKFMLMADPFSRYEDEFTFI